MDDAQHAIGIIGTGKMGAGMWRRLQSQGHVATVHDVIAAATAPLAALGAPVASDPAAVAKAVDLVILSAPPFVRRRGRGRRPERARRQRARGHRRPRHHERRAECAARVSPRRWRSARAEYPTRA